MSDWAPINWQQSIQTGETSRITQSLEFRESNCDSPGKTDHKAAKRKRGRSGPVPDQKERPDTVVWE